MAADSRWRRDDGVRDRALISGREGDGVIPLRNSGFLKVVIQLYLDAAADPHLKVETSLLQYQADRDGDRWICRYEYLRSPANPHPGMHLHVRGDLHEADALPSGTPLERIHFPTDRVSCEAVIRLLVEQFEITTNEVPEIWRPVLAETEARFAEMAHRAPSGPSG
jgi:hypothetical protein